MSNAGSSGSASSVRPGSRSSLRGSDEERQLLRRYTTQLNEQEDRLAALEREIATETAAFEKAKQELSAVINALSFDVAVPTAREQ